MSIVETTLLITRPDTLICKIKNVQWKQRYNFALLQGVQRVKIAFIHLHQRDTQAYNLENEVEATVWLYLNLIKIHQT